MLVDHWPLLGLRVRTPRLELRLPDSDQLSALADLAAEGIHDPGVMPFLHPWTDGSPAELSRSVVQHHWRQRGAWAPDDWSLGLTVLEDGVVLGLQGMGARNFAILRQVSSGSWLGARHQGRGVGTEMRAAVLHLAFAGLGAETAVSGAFEDNPASLRVSEKLGYSPDGVQRHVVRGRAVTERRLRLTRERWEAYRQVPATIEGLEPCLPLFGLDEKPGDGE